MKKKIFMVIIAAAVTAGALMGCGQGRNQEEDMSGQETNQETNQDTEQTGESMGQTGQAEENGLAEGSDGAGNEQSQEEAVESLAMYVPIAEDAYIFVDQKNGSIFTVTFPEEIYDASGNKITREQLQKGNIVKLYGNGIMLQSYPGQYPGISKMEVMEEGNPSDADQYQSLVDEIYQEPDPSEPPSLVMEYTTELAITAATVNRGGYEWTYTDEEGLSKAEAADSAHVLEWGEELIDIKLKKPLDMTLIFSRQPVSVEALRYDSGLIGETDIPEGEVVKVEERDGKLILPQVESGFVYEITGIWENGRADFGFVAIPQ